MEKPCVMATPKRRHPRPPLTALIQVRLASQPRTSNGEVERPRAGARLETGEHPFFPRPRRPNWASRTAPAIVRGPAFSDAPSCLTGYISGIYVETNRSVTPRDQGERG